jgi:hypothetical protein
MKESNSLNFPLRKWLFLLFSISLLSAVSADADTITGCITDGDCNALDGDYCSGTIMMHNEGICIDNICETQASFVEDCAERGGKVNECGAIEWSCSDGWNEAACLMEDVSPEDNLCLDYCEGSISNAGVCNPMTYNCNYNVQECNDGQYCNGQESCSNGQCVGGTPINCAAFDKPQIATCNFNPDNNPLTWDWYAGFASVCDEDLDSCTTEIPYVLHTCSTDLCLADCEENADCACQPDACIDADNDGMADDLIDYPYFGSCGDCTCDTDTGVGGGCKPAITYNDPICTECQTDSDCDNLDNIYCAGDSIKHDEGRCINYVCEVESSTVEDCSDRNRLVNDCGVREWGCSNAACYIEGVEPQDNYCSDYCYGDLLKRGLCNDDTFSCDFTNFDCNIYNSRQCNGDEVVVDDFTCENAKCAFDERLVLENCNDFDTNYCSGTSAVFGDYDCVDSQCELVNSGAVQCNDGQYCNGQESCSNGQCVGGASVNCGAFDKPQIAACDNNPDNNPWTWDWYAGFTSVCDESLDRCTTQTQHIWHTCSMSLCGAECEVDSDCEPTDCDHLDHCVGMDYYDYEDVPSSCLSYCYCIENNCGQPTIYHNDLRCGECVTDDDCNKLDRDYCSGSTVMHSEGRCVDNDCVAENSVVEDCLLKNGVMNDCGEMHWGCNEELIDASCEMISVDARQDLCPDNCEGTILNSGECNEETYVCNYDAQDCDDGLYCNGEESCSEGLCVPGEIVACSSYDNPIVSTCDNNPDNNPRTWDWYAGFTSVCDEDLDMCTTETPNILHTCSFDLCGAECEENTDCASTDCDSMDGCYGNDYYDYADVNNECGDCACEDNDCGAPVISHNDPRCTECQTDYDCADLDNDYCAGDTVMHDKGRCINYECEKETNIMEDCSGRDGVMNDCGSMQWSCESAECVMESIELLQENCPNYCKGTTSFQGECNPDTFECDYYITECNDGLYCNGEEYCVNAECVPGNAIDCSGYNITEVSTCDNVPDGNPLTLDYLAGFTSVCSEEYDGCTYKEGIFTHACDKRCGAECSVDEDCEDSLYYTVDKCLGCMCSNEIENLMIVSQPVTFFTPADERFCSTYRYDVDAVGPNPNIYYILNEGPGGMTINSMTGLIEWEPSNQGAYWVEVKATDGVLFDTQRFKLSVNNPPRDTDPREKFFISQIRTNNLVYDEVRPGEQLFVDLNFENTGRRDTDYITLRVTVEELGISRRIGPMRGPDVDEAMIKGLYLDIPTDAKPGVYTARISLSDYSGIRRTRHRDFRII